MRCCIVIAIVCLITIGCGKPSSSSGGVSPEQENQMISRLQDAHQLKGKADTGAIENAIRNFAQAEGRFPSSLEDLVAKQLLEKIPDPPAGMKFVYQPIPNVSVLLTFAIL
ncbi:MAG: hypothetical protein HY360_22585, partial [Verrucomicrobia bacterium]|nr:hypothetical protein [Verrucomicrobiota bacterium]